METSKHKAQEVFQRLGLADQVLVFLFSFVSFPPWPTDTYALISLFYFILFFFLKFSSAGSASFHFD